MKITMRYFSNVKLAKILREVISAAREGVGKWLLLFKSNRSGNYFTLFGVHSRNSHCNKNIYLLFDLALSLLEMYLTKIKTLLPKNTCVLVTQQVTVMGHQIPIKRQTDGKYPCQAAIKKNELEPCQNQRDFLKTILSKKSKKQESMYKIIPFP